MSSTRSNNSSSSSRQHSDRRKQLQATSNKVTKRGVMFPWGPGTATCTAYAYAPKPPCCRCVKITELYEKFELIPLVGCLERGLYCKNHSKWPSWYGLNTIASRWSKKVSWSYLFVRVVTKLLLCLCCEVWQSPCDRRKCCGILWFTDSADRRDAG